MLKTQEHYDLMAQFEREYSGRHDKEPKELWPNGRIYQDGQVNELFLAYRRGYALGKSISTDEVAELQEAIRCCPVGPCPVLAHFGLREFV